MSTQTALKRTLGRSGIEVSALGLGCWAIGGLWTWMDGPGGWGEINDAESIRAIHAALDHGVTFFDTAANYGTGHSEQILGQALAGRRDQAVIATKFGFKVNETDKRVTYYEDDIIGHLRTDCEASLKRLNIDIIDFYQLHVWDYPVANVPAMLDALEGLIKAGKIRTYGWSTDDVESAREFAKGTHCVGIQHDLNVVQDAPAMLALCAELNLASVNRSPLARGALTGKYNKDTVFAKNDVRSDSWSRERFLIPTLDRLEAVRDILTSGGRTLTQGALAWIWGRSQQTIPIPGFKTVAQAEENAAAMSLGPLTTDQVREINGLLDR